MNRISIDDAMLSVAQVLAKRSTCSRRDVGCVLTDIHGHILATGYNGVPVGFRACEGIDKCVGANASSGESLDDCLAIHAESNSLLQCSDVQRIHTCYITDSPCIQCLKLLLNTSCKRIVFIREYAHNQCKSMWLADDRLWIQQGISSEKSQIVRQAKAPVHAKLGLAPTFRQRVAKYLKSKPSWY